MMPYCNIKEGAGQAERLRRYIEALRIPLPQGGELHISASFGVETCLPSDTSIHEVIKRADERLYVAKNTERNQVIWHDVPLD
jgi:diguanylate cyclase (GGDEF)-like protein